MSAAAHAVHFTDPACPFAWSAEPFRLRMQWELGDQLVLERRMVGLAEAGQEYLDKGFDLTAMAEGMRALGERFGMPMAADAPRDRMAGTWAGCRGVVAVRRHAPEHEELVLRALRVGHFAGEAPLDEEASVALAATRAGLDGDEVLAWYAEEETAEAFAEDRRLARTPTAEALAQEHKLAGWSEGDASGRRYTCPSYELTAEDGRRLSLPGMRPWDAYEVALANLVPGAERRPLAEDPAEVLAWAAHPLATQEVAVLLDVDRDEARRRLVEAGAAEHPLGQDALWSAA